MSSTHEISTTSLSVLRKRQYCTSSDMDDEPPCKLKSDVFYQYVLASESSFGSDHDTESVHSIQDKETDYVRDTSDTENSMDSQDVEFEVASSSEDDEHMKAFFGELNSSSGTDDMLDVQVLAAIVGGSDSDSSSINIWAAEADTDGEEDSDEDASPKSLTRTPRLKYCVKCKGVNATLFYSYCEKCYQARKKVLPPRPRRYRSRDSLRKPSSLERSKSIVEPEKLRKYLTDLTSQEDSGVGTSQETSGDTNSQKEELSVDLGLDKIIVPAELIAEPKSLPAPSVTKSQDDSYNKNVAEIEMCIVCTTSPKSGVFVHGRFGHMCCCYRCAMKVWTRTKRCPACNCKVNNVLKVFSR